MDALVAMLVQPAPGSEALHAEAAAAGAKLLCALLCADVLTFGDEFCRAGGMAALRALISNAPVAPAVCTERTTQPSRLSSCCVGRWCFGALSACQLM
jgi:hypothetical protein